MVSQNIKEIEGFKGYFVSDDGIVLSSWKNRTTHELTPLVRHSDKDGYLDVSMYNDEKRYWRRVHRLVAETFIPNPNNYPQVNHKDGNVKNNTVDNLEWCTCQQNLIHSFRVLGRKKPITTAKRIKLTNRKTGEIQYFDSEMDCASYLDINNQHLSRMLTGKSSFDRWRKRDTYQVEFADADDVTTIPKGSTE